jgi:hypothetical protein
VANVYSTRFLVQHAGAEAVYQVPEGYRAVIRCITSFNGSAVINEVSALIHLTSGATLYQKDLGQQVWDAEDVHIVLNELEEITNAGGDDIDISVSGYLLTLP